MTMIFYCRKTKKSKLNLEETSTSMDLLQNKRPQTSNNCIRKINIRLLSASREPNKSTFERKMQAEVRSPVQVQNYFRKTEQSRLKKRGRRDQEMYKDLGSLNVTTTSWCLYDSESRKYIGFREDSKREVASLTKIMTVLVSIEALEKFSVGFLKVRITETAANLIGTSAYLKQGNWIDIKDLLYGAMLPSGNDAAYSLAEYIGYFLSKKPEDAFRADLRDGKIDLSQQSTIGYVNEFLRAMNLKAKRQDLISTWFSNPHGLQNALNISTAKDILKLSRYAVKNQLFRGLMNSKSHGYCFYQEKECRQSIEGVWRNTNRLLQKGWEGVKTGITQAAGSCLSSLKEGVFIVVLNSQNQSARFSDTQKIYNWYQSNVAQRRIATISAASLRESAESQMSKLHFKTEGSI